MGTPITAILVLFLVACGSSTPPAPAQPAPAPGAEHAHHDHAQHQHHHAQHQHHGSGMHRFEKAEDWVPMFDDPKRDEWQKPDAVVAALELRPGMTVADVGAGTGYFSKRLATGVGPNGKVIAVDLEPDMVRYLGERAQKENTPNVEPRLGAADDPKLGTASVDRILIVDVWHHLTERDEYARKIAAALKPGGFVLVVDFTLEAKRGPPPQHRLAPTVIGGELESAGLFVLPIDAGLPDQYVLKGEKR